MTLLSLLRSTRPPVIAVICRRLSTATPTASREAATTMEWKSVALGPVEAQEGLLPERFVYETLKHQQPGKMSMSTAKSLLANKQIHVLAPFKYGKELRPVYAKTVIPKGVVCTVQVPAQLWRDCQQTSALPPPLIYTHDGKTLQHCPTAPDRRFLCYKEARMPSVSSHFLDPALSVEAQLYQTWGSCNVPQQGLLHRLDNESNGWLLGTRNQEEYTTLMELRSVGKVKSLYQIKCVANRHVSAALLDFSKPLKSCLNLPGTMQVQRKLLRDPQTGKTLLLLTIDAHVRNHGRIVEVASVPEANRTLRKQLTMVMDVDGLKHNTNRDLTATVALSQGFRHQIRVMLSALGLPLVGCSLYGDKTSHVDPPMLQLTCIGYLIDGELFSDAKFYTGWVNENTI